ncbi:DUF3291 domain-containing protein [Methylocystis heyeri]|uniref:DUF3291 domain-containing protein n=2 Tax=Methylocystis heyeri TaxID=391905 RepID=A0A6B8KAN3_9HYPH|nr:DUF3291 domain-containing protein [Methylocystis heyeri]
MPLVSITRLRLRSWGYLPAFIAAAVWSVLQARRARGNLAVGVSREAGNVFWTRSIWTDESAMRSFRDSGAHRAAMPKLLDWCDEASVVHWTQESAQPPTWKEAHLRMQRDGRPSRVKHPSEAHRRFECQKQGCKSPHPAAAQRPSPSRGG